MTESTGISVKKILRGGFWFYGVNIANNVFGFIYWIIISSIGGPGVLGVTSAIIGFSFMIGGILGFGLNRGVQRFLGICIGRKDNTCFSRYFWSTIIFSSIIYSIEALVLLMLGIYGVGIGPLTPNMLVAACFLVVLSLSTISVSVLIASLRTDIYFASTIIANIIKFVVGVSLVYYGWGWFGVTLGYMSVGLVNLSISLLYALKISRRRIYFSAHALKETLKASLVVWLPNVIIIVGQWLGVLAVFSASGAVETGYYYIAFSVANIVLMLALSTLSILLPALSGMSDGRKRTASEVLDIVLVLVLPITVISIIYSSLILGLIGKEYMTAANILSIFAVSVIPLSITVCVVNLTYAYGNYRQILAIGLSQNLPRIILYYVLTPIYGGLGAAFSYLIGAITGFTYSIKVAKSIGFNIPFTNIIKTIIVPFILGGILKIFNVPFIIGLPLLLSSYIIYMKTGIITRRKLRNIVEVFISADRVLKIYRRFKPLVDTLLPEE